MAALAVPRGWRGGPNEHPGLCRGLALPLESPGAAPGRVTVPARGAGGKRRDADDGWSSAVAAPVTPRAPADLSLTAVGPELGRLGRSQREGEISMGEVEAPGNHTR